MSANTQRFLAICLCGSFLTAPAFAADNAAAGNPGTDAMLAAVMARLEKLEESQKQMAQANAQLQQENTNLKEQLAEVEKTAQEASDKVTAASASIEPSAGGATGDTKIPGTDTTIKLGGYVKADAILDVGTGHGADFVNFATIPLDGSAAGEKSSDFHMHARQSRLNVTTTTPTEMGDIKIFVEGDLYGTRGSDLITNNHAPQLRQAYGEFNGFLAGQTWTTFVDMAAYPESLDYVGPVGLTLMRQTQARYSGTLDDGWSYSVALENPNADFVNAGADTVVDGSKWPDVTMALTKKGDWGHVSLRGVARDIEVENETDMTADSAFGYGVAASAKLKVGEKDSLAMRAAYGDGIGRYIYDVANSGQAAGYNNDSLETQSAYAGYASYQHYWTDTLRSNVMGGYVGIDNATDLIGTSRNETLWSGHANLIWQPVSKFKLGMEYMHGYRELESGQDGDLDRVMASVTYSLD